MCIPAAGSSISASKGISCKAAQLYSSYDMPLFNLTERMLNYSLQTHNVAMAGPISRYVVLMGIDGTIANHGTVSEVIAQEEQLAEMVAHEQALVDTDKAEASLEKTTPVLTKAQGAKLIAAEEIAVGHVTWPACMSPRLHISRLKGLTDGTAVKMYLKSLGGDWPALFWSSYALFTVLSKLFDTGATWWLGW